MTSNGVSTLSPRKKGAVRGVVEALMEMNILPPLSLNKLCKFIGNQIQLEIKSKLEFSDTSEKFKQSALNYIKKNPHLKY